MKENEADTQYHVDLNEKYGAHNYEPYSVIMVRGKGASLWDIDGKQYIDCLGCYSAVNHGHCHPRIVEVAKKQAELLTALPRCLLHDKSGPFYEKLAKLCRKDKVLMASGGAEAVETALKIARKWGEKVKGVPPNRGEIITFAGNFHGRTIGIVSFSTEPQYRDGFGPLLTGFKTVPYGDVMTLWHAITPNTVAVLIEPIQGEGGIIVPPPYYLSNVRRICTKENVLMIGDEIQTGLGRTGRMFCLDHENVVPDMYILAKALGGGYPVSAVVANDDIMQVMTPGDHGSTFGGNPFACAVGYEALSILTEEGLVENAAKMGEYFMHGLRAMNSPFVKEVRGKGLLIGAEIKPECGTAPSFVKQLIQVGVIVKETHETVIRFAPPLVITKEEVDLAMERIQSVLLPRKEKCRSFGY